MPTRIDRYELQQLIEQRAQVVEVLPSEEFDQEHIAGAVNIPLADLDPDARARLSSDRPVVVYCNDYLCDMSPRAAKRLQRLGFTDVYDYMPGKVDWMAAGMAREGSSVELNAGDVADPDVPDFDLRSPSARALAVLDKKIVWIRRSHRCRRRRPPRPETGRRGADCGWSRRANHAAWTDHGAC